MSYRSPSQRFGVALLALVVTTSPIRPAAAQPAPGDPRAAPVLVESANFKAHDGGISSIGFSSDGKSVLTVVAGTGEKKPGNAALWDAGTQKLKWRLDDLHPFDAAIRFHPVKNEVLIGQRHTDLASGKELRTIRPKVPIKLAVFSPDGKRLVTSSHIPRDQPVEVEDGVVVWDFAKAEAIAMLRPGGKLTEQQRMWWTALDWSQDGKYIVTVHSADKDAGEVNLWDASDFSLLNRFIGHGKRVYAAAFSPDGKFIATAGKDNKVRLWEVEKLLPPAAKAEEVAKLVAGLDSDDDKTRGAAKAALIKLEGRAITAVSEAGAKSKSQRVQEAAKEIAAAFEAREVKPKHTLGSRGTRSLRFSPDGRFLAAGNDSHELVVWRMTEPETRLFHFRSDSGIFDIAFSPKGDMLATAGGNGVVRLWHVTAAP